MQRSILILLCILFTVPAVAQDRYMFVFLNKKENKDSLSAEELKTLMEGHLANITRLAEEKKLLAAGPFDGGGGIFVLNTSSVDEAKGWLSTDPGIKANRWNIELLPCTLSYGSICPVDDTAEMVTYSFTRFTPHVTKHTVKTAAGTLRQHEGYVSKLMEQGNGVAVINFEERAGSAVIMKGDVAADVWRLSPAVEATLLNFEIKKLWIGKGSFCEK